MKDLGEIIKINCNICLEIKKIQQRIIKDKKRLQYLKMFYKLKITKGENYHGRFRGNNKDKLQYLFRD